MTRTKSTGLWSFSTLRSGNEDVKRIIKVLLYTGMRSGECLGLAWEDIDFEEMTITINHNLTDIGGKHELGSPLNDLPKERSLNSSPYTSSAIATQRY